MKQRKIFAILAMVLVLVLSVGVFAACNPKEDNTDKTDPDAERLEQYLAESAKVYGEQLGDFKAAYAKAVEETKKHQQEICSYGTRRGKVDGIRSLRSRYCKGR